MSRRAIRSREADYDSALSLVDKIEDVGRRLKPFQAILYHLFGCWLLSTRWTVNGPFEFQAGPFAIPIAAILAASVQRFGR